MCDQDRERSAIEYIQCGNDREQVFSFGATCKAHRGFQGLVARKICLAVGNGSLGCRIVGSQSDRLSNNPAIQIEGGQRGCIGGQRDYSTAVTRFLPSWDRDGGGGGSDSKRQRRLFLFPSHTSCSLTLVSS